ncbi:MAG: hypothetical protein IPH31_06115 [Lewinellaceae bacterium]|nr:hypothetical protein [Lewinellaceae bacterium]
MENDFVTIARFQFVHDPGLEMLQIKLEDAGIQSVVFNQNMGGLAPLHNWASGGIQVRVPAENEPLAALIWEELQKTLEYADFEDPELAKMRSEEDEGMQRNWRACLVVLAMLVFIIAYLIYASR